MASIGRARHSVRAVARGSNRRAEDCPPCRAVRELRFVQSDAGADPGLVDVEINAHHFALTHPNEIVDERGIAILIRPHKHHPDLRL